MDKIANKLDNINGTLEKMLKVMSRPKSPFQNVLETAGMLVGIFGIIASIDIIFRWFKEGL